MKIQIDTQSKTILIQEKISLDEFWKEIQTMLPNGTWKEYTIDKAIEYISIPYTNPFPQVVPWSNPPYYPQQPIIYTGGTNPYTVTYEVKNTIQ
jgi:hypothetical protein